MARIAKFISYTLFNLVLFIKNLLLSPFSKLARYRLYHINQVLVYPFFGDRYVELYQLLKDDNLSLTLSPVKARKHNTTEFELLSICALLKDNSGNAVFEIGTFDGRTTRAMAQNLLNNDGKIFTLNLPPNTEHVDLVTDKVDVNLASQVVSGERFLNTAQQKYIEQIWGDSSTFDFTAFTNKMDMVFIDGAHSKEYVQSDTNNAIKLIKQKGGIIIWHDAHLFGVVKFLAPWIEENKLPVYFLKGTTLAVAAVKNGSIVDIRKN